MTTKLKRSDYSVGWICAIDIELAAVVAVLDEVHPQLEAIDGDTNVYKFGRIGGHNVVISWLPKGQYGLTRAAVVVSHMLSAFTRLRFGLMVGVGGGAPNLSNDIRLGDLVVSQPTGVSSGVIQYDFGKAVEGGEFKLTGLLNAPPTILLNAVLAMTSIDQEELGKKISTTACEIEQGDRRFHYPGQDSDKLYRAEYNHVLSEGQEKDTCDACDVSNVVARTKRSHSHPHIHYGIIASGNQVMKDGRKRDIIGAQTGALCFEMEAAGLMNDFRCLVIRGICDYSDGHKNKCWQPYAALVAAIYAKELLLQIPTVNNDQPEDVATDRKKVQENEFVIPFRMPFPRNSTFVGRVEELETIYQYFMESKSTADTPHIFALTGTGGMGKTQTAIEYAYRHYHHDYAAVFWVSAESESTIRTSFVSIIQQIVEEEARITWPDSAPDYETIGWKLGVSVDETGRVSADSEIVKSALFRWLQLPGNNRWLLIFDNADDVETFDIQEYFPNHGGGAILITSRRPEFSHYAEQANLDGLDRASAARLLISLAQLPGSLGDVEDAAITLVEKLGFMPLAISHAGCFIHQTKVSLEEYIHHYDTAFMTVQSIKPKSGWNYRNNTAATTWELSFSEVKKQNKEAALLLQTCSYFNYEEIFEDFWVDGKYYQVSPLELKTRIQLLESYSLIRIIRSGVFSIHPVVHSWARGRLQHSQPERFQVMGNALIVLGGASQSTKVSQRGSEWDPQVEQRTAAHLEYLHRYFEMPCLDTWLCEEQKVRNEDLPGILNSIALVLSRREKYDEALPWFERALMERENPSNQNYSRASATPSNSKSVFDKKGEYKKVIKWCKRALAGNKTSLGRGVKSSKELVSGEERAPDQELLSVSDIVHNIASILRLKGDYYKAMQWYERALINRETTLGKDHPSTLFTVHNIATLLGSQGRYYEAMQWYNRALIGQEKVLGTDHPSTLLTVHNMATLFGRESKYDEALQWYNRALAGQEKALGTDHPTTLATVHNIAGIIGNQGKYGEAVQWYERALVGQEKALGKDHPSTLLTIHDLAYTLKDQGKNDEAIQWGRRALAGREKILGKNHPQTLLTADNLAKLTSKDGGLGS
ncbi:hypothetical protein TWF281_008565 [Arthrobotrys megalospora]